MVLFQDIRVDCPHPFALLTGGDDLYLPSLALGGDGGILACAAVIPEVFVKMDEAIAAGDYETARRCHYAEKLLNDVMYKGISPCADETGSGLQRPAGRSLPSAFYGS